MKTILSGIQASGRLTLGNYLGALKNWKMLKDDGNHACWFFIADLHSITVKQNPAELHERSLEIMKIYLASGLVGGNNNIFFQSHVPEHTELAWVLGCHTHLGELSRMTQFKDKSAKNQESITSGLFTYPVLMAADILLYQADLVPVGADQKQHLELTRDIAIRFNSLYGNGKSAPAVFKVPEPFIPKEGARIMSLQDPTSKMSKSDPNANAFILLLDEPDVIMKKIKRAVTDSEGRVAFEDKPERAGVANLMNIYSATTGATFTQIEEEFEGKGYGDFKQAVGEAVIAELSSLQTEFRRLSGEEGYVKKIYEESALRAREVASETLKKAYDCVGFVRS